MIVKIAKECARADAGISPQAREPGTGRDAHRHPGVALDVPCLLAAWVVLITTRSRPDHAL